MQGVAVKQYFYAPVVANYRYRLPARDLLDVHTCYSFPLKKTIPSLKSKGGPFLHVGAFFDSSVNKRPEDILLHNNLRFLPLKRGSCLAGASTDKPTEPMKEKPKWWWRSLACLPYLMIFLAQLTWVHAHPSQNPPQFLANFNELFLPLRSSLLALPKFLLSSYPIIVYYWIVRRKEWPEFFRRHVINAVLLGSLVQVIGTSSGWFPKMLFPPHFWSATTFLFLVTVLECIRCALAGEDPSIPFVKVAAEYHLNLEDAEKQIIMCVPFIFPWKWG